MSDQADIHYTDKPDSADEKIQKPKSWLDKLRENPNVEIGISAVSYLALGLATFFLANIVYDGNVLTTTPGIIGLTLAIIVVVVRIYQGEKDLESIIKFARVHWAVVFIMLPLTMGSIGYSWTHWIAMKNKWLQNNEVVRAERERAHGVEAELISDEMIVGHEYKTGHIFPVVTKNGSILAEQEGPYKFIFIFLPNQTGDITKFRIRWDKAITGHKTIHRPGVDLKPIDHESKVFRITFLTNNSVCVIDDFKAGQKIKLSGYGDDEVYFRDGDRLAKVPASGIITSAVNQPLEITYKKGGILFINNS